MERPWVELREVVDVFNVTYPTAKNRIYAGTFPVPVYREGRTLVVDKATLQAYLDRRRTESLSKLG